MHIGHKICKKVADAVISIVEKLLQAMHLKVRRGIRDDECFCRMWAELESRHYDFHVRHMSIWESLGELSSSTCTGGLDNMSIGIAMMLAMEKA